MQHISTLQASDTYKFMNASAQAQVKLVRDTLTSVQLQIPPSLPATQGSNFYQAVLNSVAWFAHYDEAASSEGPPRRLYGPAALRRQLLFVTNMVASGAAVTAPTLSDLNVFAHLLTADENAKVARLSSTLAVNLQLVACPAAPAGGTKKEQVTRRLRKEAASQAAGSLFD